MGHSEFGIKALRAEMALIGTHLEDGRLAGVTGTQEQNLADRRVSGQTGRQREGLSKG